MLQSFGLRRIADPFETTGVPFSLLRLGQRVWTFTCSFVNDFQMHAQPYPCELPSSPGIRSSKVDTIILGDDVCFQQDEGIRTEGLCRVYRWHYHFHL